MILLLLVASLIQITQSWPDGAPCLITAYESMNPLEAVEHQGGLQLTPPPYEIKVDQKCYWRNQPLTLHLQGVNESVWFKGFVIQPFEWRDGFLGERMGQLMRLDDNGSWQQQCFRFKNSATHSHDEKKKHMRLWWKIDEDSRTVQFVATVVKHQTMFWVKSVVSDPIPPCRVSKMGYVNYQKPMPTPPPPVKQFKMDTSRLFGTEGIQLLPVQPLPPQPQPQFRSQSQPTQRVPDTTTVATTTPPPTTTTAAQPASSSSPRMKQIIPVPDGFKAKTTTERTVIHTTPVSKPRKTHTRPQTQTVFTKTTTRFAPEPVEISVTQTPFTSVRTRPTTAFVPQEQQFIQQQFTQQPRQFTFIRPEQSSFRQSFINTIQPRPSPVPFQFTRTTRPTPDVRRPTAMVRFCFDRDGADRCADWVPYCRSERFYAYMRSYCTRSCGFC
ncbi:unnamed protein product [Cylicocyclus nassatus]|uniref:ShKT domain-containing protein n=1 Tax=Cylicocyclus nassatus TaxID=53992 RepID=A0AA36DS84_CYLNA|nr:unnamed protein product [Cylicocyclus nassatus]